MPLKNNLKQFYCLLLFGLVTNYSYADIQLRFGLYTSDKPSELIKKFKPVINEIKQQLSLLLKQTVSIKIIIAPGYKQGIKQLVESKIDFMRMGPAS